MGAATTLNLPFVRRATARLTLLAVAGTIIVFGVFGAWKVIFTSHITCTVSGSGVITGTPGDDVICGSDLADVISGLGGNDTIIPGAGDDVIDGGLGTDTLDFTHSTHAITVDLTVGTQQNTGD